MARFIGAGYVAFAAVTVAEAGQEVAAVAWWWAPAAAIAVIGPGIALLAASWWTGARAERNVRIAAISAVACYALAAACWLLTWTGETVAGSSSTWLVRFSGLVGLCAALVWRPGYVFMVQAAATAASSLINQLALVSPQPLWLRVGTETLWALGFSGVFVAAAIMAVRTSRTLDATHELVGRAAALSAAHSARERERAKFDALVHDRVIAVLLDASRTTIPQRLPAQARAALSALDELAAPAEKAPNLTSAEVFDHLRIAVEQVGADIAVSVSCIDDARSMFPVQSVSELIDATTQAVHNSTLHAGADPRTRVVLTVSTEHIRIVVEDRGEGFDPRTVPPSRFGVEGSIRGRMNRLPGGHANVVSSIGAGTTVELLWTRPEVTLGLPVESDTNVAPISPLDTAGPDAVRPPDPKHVTSLPLRGDISTIIGMQSAWAMVTGAVFVLCAAGATFSSLDAGMAAPSALAVLTLLAVGVVVVVAAGGDPVHRWAQVVCAAVPPVQIAAAWHGLPEPMIDPLRTAAAASGGVVLCAFLCVRGRVGAAWTSQAAVVAVYAAWGLHTGHGLAMAAAVLIADVGVMTMATLFAQILRPAAREVYHLRRTYAENAAEEAARDAAHTERQRQTRRLDALARPTLALLVTHPALTDEQRAHTSLLEARLRDSIRARALDITPIADAAWSARTRGVTVVLLDDGALVGASAPAAAAITRAAARHLDAAESGTVTVRIAPPSRTYLATIITNNGQSTSRHEYDRTGREHTKDGC